MRRVVLIIFNTYLYMWVYGQNLIPNSSFEDSLACPTMNGQLDHTKYWFQPCNAVNSSTDYFNECESTQGSSIPSNAYGYQYAKSGVAYTGVVTYDDFPINNNYREYLEVKLLSPLLNVSYCVSFYVSRADYTRYAINTIGCLFTVDSFLTDSINQPISLIPQIENTQGIINDTTNWTLISGEFIATGGEHFLTIGNFRSDANTTVFDNMGFMGYAYYYIDDVSITLCDTTAVEEKGRNDSWQLTVYPNPTITSATVTTNGGNKIVITDITGRKIKEYFISGNQLKIDTDEFNNGIYFLALYDNGSLVATEKLIIAE